MHLGIVEGWAAAIELLKEQNRIRKCVNRGRQRCREM